MLRLHLLMGGSLEARNKWTNPSVMEFAKGADPVVAITKAAREVVVRAIDGLERSTI